MNIWIVVLSLWLFISTYNVQGYCENYRQGHGVKLALSSPQYLSVGDESNIDITVLNESSEAATITVTLRYLGDSLCLTESGAANFIVFKSLPSQGRATSPLKVQFPSCFRQSSFHNHPGRQADFNIWLIVDKHPPQDLGNFSVQIMPFPISKVGNLLGALLLGLTAFWAKELWDLIKEEAKTPATIS